jgi:hypothetical protein
MKNTFKFFGIIVMVSVIAFSMTACNMDPGDDGVPKSLEITGITGAGVPSSGKVAVGIADVSKRGKANLVAYSEVNVAPTVDIPLISALRQGEQYTGTGDYFIILIFDKGTENDTSDDVNYVYSGGTTSPMKYKITNALTSLSFDKFIELE